jgi:autonomous glycyl radical cofactor GrcA
MAATKNQVDNLVALLDGYAEKGGHHLNVNVFTKETLLAAHLPRLNHFRFCGNEISFFAEIRCPHSLFVL